MPPVRGPPANSKALKTERTHEENQERAYIAASRRSDRSLEARIESARRASEIHKKRTGRGLRVTEQDVINEEMYEEEDDDLPSQYRRLQAHLAGSADIFNGRLNSYIMSTLGTRGLLFQNGTIPAMTPQPNTPFFSYNPSASPSQMATSHAAQRNQNYRQSPYPAQAYRSNTYDHSRSVPNPSYPTSPTGFSQQDVSSTTDTEGQNVASSPQASQSQSSTPVQSGNQMGPPISSAASHPANTAFSQVQANMFSGSPQIQQQFALQHPFGFSSAMSSFDPAASLLSPNNTSPLSPALPPETQQLIGTSAFDPTHYYTPYLMNTSHGLTVPTHSFNYSYNPNLSSSKRPQDVSSQGMNQTLAQSPIGSMSTTADSSLDQLNMPTYTSPQVVSMGSNPATSYDNNFNFSMAPFTLPTSADGTQTTNTPTQEYDSLINYQEEHEFT